MQQNAQAVSIWAIENELGLNIQKSNNVMFMRSEGYIQLNTHDLPPILINSEPLNYVELVINLGLWLTPTSDWITHVEHILKKVDMSRIV